MVLPYLVGDSAFTLSSSLLKCYNESGTDENKLTFKYRLMLNRRIVSRHLDVRRDGFVC